MKGFIICAGILGAATISALSASKNGYGLTKPSKQPMSIREGSVKGADGRTRTRFFVGGGIHGGK